MYKNVSFSNQHINLTSENLHRQNAHAILCCTYMYSYKNSYIFLNPNQKRVNWTIFSQKMHPKRLRTTSKMQQTTSAYKLQFYFDQQRDFNVRSTIIVIATLSTINIRPKAQHEVLAQAGLLINAEAQQSAEQKIRACGSRVHRFVA